MVTFFLAVVLCAPLAVPSDEPHSEATSTPTVTFAKAYAIAIQGKQPLYLYPTQELANAYAFVFGQHLQLQSINEDFLNLTDEAYSTRLAFEKSALGKGFIHLETVLSDRFGEDWPAIKSKLQTQLATVTGSRLVTKQEAVDFLSEVQARTKGTLPIEMRAALLSANPLYMANPKREFQDGWIQTFQTHGHGKSKGARLSFSYPMSWRAAEGQLPNVVHKFVSQDGHGPEMVTIATKNLPLSPGEIITDQDRQDLFSTAVLQETIPEKATLIATQATQLEASPAGIVEYTMVHERLGIRFLTHAWTIRFLCENTLVEIMFGIRGPVGYETELAQRMDMYKPLFYLMANSIVLTDKWTAGQPSSHFQDELMSAVASEKPSLQSLQPPNDKSPLIATPIVVFALACGIVLTPTLTIRYIIERRPLDRKTASWLAVGIVVLIHATAIALDDGEGDAPRIGVGDVLVFLVSRWIMTRGCIPAATISGRAPLEGDASSAPQGHMAFRRFLRGSG
ncbi:MAG: hypothetical protein C0485_01790 [Pirellula sp.]|nr:hypothetical protein [Pirellula sp.]